MIPTKPDWQAIVNDLYSRHGSYKRLQNALSKQDVYPDHSTLSHLRSRHGGGPMWALGAALLNLHGEQK